ncbi:helix-turn-helix domain-containing protein, partial [Vibrio cholerae]|uniref:helix-turn-helix domain-containing protein n=1 Tax=Vibrio cholerae TaxID=666 RepID=UPI001965A0C1
MDVYQEYTMSATANISFIFHRPKYNGNMKRLQAFTFQLRPNGQQEREMRRFAGACR